MFTSWILSGWSHCICLVSFQAAGGDNCCMCGGATGKMAKCDNCPRNFHLQCLEPPLSKYGLYFKQTVGHFELSFAPVPNQVFVWNDSCENVFPPQVYFHVNRTHFHMKCFAHRLVLKPRHEVTGNGLIFVSHLFSLLTKWTSLCRVPRASWTCPNCKRVSLMIFMLSQCRV